MKIHVPFAMRMYRTTQRYRFFHICGWCNPGPSGLGVWGLPSWFKLLLLVLLAFVPVAQADSPSLAQVTSQIKKGSALTLRNDVAQDFSENLLAAQQPGVCDYCAFEPDSLQLSINAVLKALTLEQSFGLKFCDDFNCQIAWDQSTVAIDDRVSIGLSATSLNFGEVPVSTPEPETWILVLAGLAVILGWSYTGRRKSEDYLYVHTERKA